jgi:hypothetical protein
MQICELEKEITYPSKKQRMEYVSGDRVSDLKPVAGSFLFQLLPILFYSLNATYLASTYYKNNNT